MEKKREKGIIYVASGQAFIEEACSSAESVRRHMPDVPITLFTHQRVSPPEIDDVIVDERLEKGGNPKEGKIACLSRTPYDRTLFLDTDTYICEDISELFLLLDAFEVAAAHDPARLYYAGESHPSTLPESFPELNTGVLLYKTDSPSVRALLRAWKERYGTMGGGVPERDQLSFREVLFESDVRMTTLPSEYNCRFNFPMYLDGPAKVLHGRHDSLSYEEVAQILNVNGKVYEDGIHRRVFHVQSGRLSFPWRAMASIPKRLAQMGAHSFKIIRSIFSRR
ncbi:hypothetical protein GGQ04_002668 [Salinibacter ruber]|uniref:hypothetical protein n=1 Tax=Salinibacter ruber TaxID=146919 RepID=UPI0021677338|nr:hypothetical protein [Salinibacter ruber]MCS4047520.1 hypothetical protein [Salinibacter ruber]